MILGEDTRSFLACVRSLGRQGVEVHVAPYELTSSALRSRYIEKIHRLPYYTGDGARWLAAIGELMARERFDLVMPCVDSSLLPLAAHRDTLSPLGKLAIPDNRSIDVLFDKVETRKIAEQCGIPVAQGLKFSPGAAIEPLVAALGLPLVCKPPRSYRLSSLHRRERVQIVSTLADARELLAKCGSEGALLERFFAGQGVGVSILAADGDVLQYFEHARVHDSEDAASGYRVSRTVDPALANACQQIAAALRYTGLAMFEFKFNDASGRWILLEVNARPWGSLPLPVSLGVDFPFWWFRLLTEGHRTAAKEYRPGRFARNLTIDLNYILQGLRLRREQPGKLIGFMAGNALEPLRAVVGRERNDTLTLDDPAPGMDEVAKLFRSLLHKLVGRPAEPVRSKLERHLHRLASKGTARVHLEFVCLGNICRSPYAERLLAMEIANRQLSLLAVGSSGTIPIEGREAPPEAVETAARRSGVDLSRHRSRLLTQDLVERAGVLIVFDRKNEQDILRQHPEARAKMFWLGDFIEGIEGDARGPAIADPYGGPHDVYDESYARIEQGIRGLVQVIAAPFQLQR